MVTIQLLLELIDAAPDPRLAPRWDARLRELTAAAMRHYEPTRGVFLEHARVDGGDADEGRFVFDSPDARLLNPGHSIEMASAYLDRQVATILARKRITKASATQVHHLAAVIHLCGAGAGASYAQRRFQLTRNQRCGDHSVRAYLARMDSMKKTFSGFAAS